MSAATAFRVRQLSGLLRGFAYRYASELELHERIAGVLTNEGIAFERERVLNKNSRADFWLADGIAIEVKVDGSLGPALRQCARYLEIPEVNGVLLASACGWARNVPVLSETYRQRLAVAYLKRQAL